MSFAALPRPPARLGAPPEPPAGAFPEVPAVFLPDFNMTASRLIVTAQMQAAGF